jgi:hypothetical protein
MRSTIIGTTLVALAAASTIGCSFAARSPDMYRDDVRAVLETKNADVKACYDAVITADPQAVGNVTVRFDVMTETGQITNVMVDETNSTAPQGVKDCVTNAITGLAIDPPDANMGKATFVYEFQIAPQQTAPAKLTPPAKS